MTSARGCPQRPSSTAHTGSSRLTARTNGCSWCSNQTRRRRSPPEMLSPVTRGRWDTRRQRSREQPPRHLRLGGEGHRLGHARLLAPVGVVSPFAWQGELPVQQDLALRRRVGQKYADLAVLDASRLSPVVPLYPPPLPSF